MIIIWPPSDIYYFDDGARTNVPERLFLSTRGAHHITTISQLGQRYLHESKNQTYQNYLLYEYEINRRSCFRITQLDTMSLFAKYSRTKHCIIDDIKHQTSCQCTLLPHCV
jgi:hypothetical protein